MSEIRAAAEIAAALLIAPDYLDTARSTSWMNLSRKRGSVTAPCATLVRAAGLDDGEIGDPDEAEDKAEVGAFHVIGLHGRT